MPSLMEADTAPPPCPHWEVLLIAGLAPPEWWTTVLADGGAVETAGVPALRNGSIGA